MSKKRAISVAVINLLVFSAVYAVFDLILGLVLNDPVKFMCKDTRLHHRYCPMSTRVYRMTPADGGEVFSSHWNAQSLRVETSRQKRAFFNVKEYDVVNIGDSFMAQRQVDFHDRLSNVLEKRTGLSILQVGTGSWTVINYRNWIEDQLFKEGAIVNVFLMANDLYSFGYGSSNKNYHEAASVKNGEFSWEGAIEETNHFQRLLLNHSFTFQRLSNSSKENSYSQYLDDYQTLDLSFSEVSSNCTLLENLSLEKQFTPLTISNIVYAFEESCWPQEMSENLKLTAQDINSIKEHLQQFKANVCVYIVPNGWVLEGEVLEAKKHPLYQIGERTVITMAGLSGELASQLTVPVISLEHEFKAIKQSQSELLYYPYDAHWNAYGTEIVAEIISNNSECPLR